MINNAYINNLSQSIDSSDPKALKDVLVTSHKLRQQYDQKMHFWNFSEKKTLRRFDAVFNQGIEKLAQHICPASEIQGALIDGKMPPEGLKKTIAVALGGFAGWLVGGVYTMSMSNDILHEYGHALAYKATTVGAHPAVHTNAWYWLSRHEFWKWFIGQRSGGPGNYTSLPEAPVSHFGSLMSPAARDFFVTAAGVGSELAVNTLVAGLGLVAIRKKYPVLGASLIGFALIAHSAAHSYIRRGFKGGDPADLTQMIANFFGCSLKEAYHVLYWGYFLLPFLLLAIPILLFMKASSAIPDEAVLMQFLAENQQIELKKILIETEIETHTLCQNIQNDKDKEKALWHISQKIIEKIKNDKQLAPLFESKRQELENELKGEQNSKLGFNFRLKGFATISATIANQLRFLGQTLVPKLAVAINYLAGIFIGLQTVSFALDMIETYHDLQNDQQTMLAKALSCARLFLSLATLVFVSTALFVSALNPAMLTFFVASLAARLILYAIYLFDSHRSSLIQAGDKAPSIRSIALSLIRIN